MSTRTKAILGVITGNTIFGFSFIFSKMALQITVPSVVVAVRFLTAFLVLSLIAVIGSRIQVRDRTAGPGEAAAAHAGSQVAAGTGAAEGQGITEGPGSCPGEPAFGKRPLVSFSLRGKPLRYVLLLALFQPILYFLCESYGIVYTSSAFAGTIIAVIPIAGIVLDVLIMHSKVRLKQVVCAVLSAVGVAITTVGATGMRSSLLGLLILLGAVASGALFYVFSKKSGAHYNPLEQTWVMFGMGSLTYVTAALIQCRGQYQEMILDALVQPVFITAILYLGVVSSVVAFIALNYGTVRITVSEAALFANLTTVISIIAGVVFLHETFTPFQIAGAILIIGSVYASNRTHPAKAGRPAEEGDGKK